LRCEAAPFLTTQDHQQLLMPEDKPTAVFFSPRGRGRKKTRIRSKNRLDGG
jgi:hypothetical protein